MKIIVSFITSFIMLLSVFLPINALAEESQIDEEETTSEITDPPTEAEPNITLPDDLRAVTLIPGVDFALSEDDGELDNALSQLSEWGMNTIYLYSSNENQAFFSFDENDKTDVLSIACEKIREQGFTLFITLDVNLLLAEALKSENIQDNYFMQVHRFTRKYYPDGIILSNYYSENSQDSFNFYKKTGLGIGMKNWLYENNEYYIKSATEMIRMTSNSIAIGMLISDPWANEKTMENGSPTTAKKEALTSGFSDTKKYIENKIFDFVIVNANGSTTSSELPFESYSEWWDNVCDSAEIPMYITHANENMSENWGADQLLKQLTIAKKLKSYKGSGFNSLKTLVANPQNSTDNLVKFYENQINENDLFSELSIYSPKKTSFTTYEDKVAFMGTFDSNFEVYLDDKKIELKDTGDFYVSKDLKIGSNTIKFKHKDKTITYKIKRAVKVLDSMNPTKDVSVEGGTTMSVSAVAYKGSTVKATFNGQTITLKESPTDDIQLNSLYIRYTGSFKIPKGIISKKQNLGRVKISASYSEFSESLTGGNVTVNALPEPPPPPPPPVVVVPPEEAIEGEVIMKIEPNIPEGYETEAKLVKTNKNSTIVYDGKTIDAYSFPNYVMLPEGTLDYYSKTSNATNDGGVNLSFNNSISGRKYSSDDSTIITAKPITSNQAFVKAIGTKNNKSYIKISLDHKIAFNIQPIGMTYLAHVEGNYRVQSFNPKQYEIIFENVTEVTKLPSFDNHQIFKSGKWETITVDGVQKFRLLLDLRQEGIYGGCSSYYDSNGDLVLSFTNYSSGVSGKTIVIDPGHGYTGENRYDPGAVRNSVEEADINYAVAILLEKKLKELGANVVKFDVMDKNKYYLTTERKFLAEQYGADLYISIHCNSAGSTSANGVETFYFHASGQPLARAVTDELNKAYQKHLYKDSADHRRNTDNGAPYYRFNVTTSSAFPSVLTEMGFLSNSTEAKLLANTSNHEHLAEALKNGIVNYFNRSSLPNFSNGENTATKSEEDPEPEPEPEPESELESSQTSAISTQATTEEEE